MQYIPTTPAPRPSLGRAPARYFRGGRSAGSTVITRLCGYALRADQLFAGVHSALIWPP